MSEAAVIPRHSLSETSLLSAGSVLIIDDEAAIRESLQTLLELEGYAVESAATRRTGPGAHWRTSIRPGAARPGAARSQWAWICWPRFTAHDPQLSVIMITAYGTVENAVSAMQAGRPTSSKSPGTTKSCWPMFAPRSAGTAPKKKTSNSSARSSSATTSKTSWAKASPC